MVEGTGLENQRRKRPQVRILSFPPELKEDPLGSCFNSDLTDSSLRFERSEATSLFCPFRQSKIV